MISDAIKGKEEQSERTKRNEHKQRKKEYRSSRRSKKQGKEWTPGTGNQQPYTLQPWLLPRYCRHVKHALISSPALGMTHAQARVRLVHKLLALDVQMGNIYISYIACLDVQTPVWQRPETGHGRHGLLSSLDEDASLKVDRGSRPNLYQCRHQNLAPQVTPQMQLQFPHSSVSM